MTREDYAAKVTDMAEREENARLFLAMRETEDALEKAQLVEDDPPGLTEVYMAYRQKVREAELWYDAERAKLLQDSPSSALNAAAVAALAAYNDAPGGAIEESGEGGVLRCALSGAPLCSNDETIDIGGHEVLMSLFVPADVIEALRGSDEPEDEEIEEAA